ncbi:MAG: glycoside hydrolase family 2 TIM barrel-domain containing protein [Candidatus Omnitrophica bacterium]|nr:glycoside hydrolase family 2 TIM barrel-domain containing protein [Candidatus Omnitrophota bacterium]
MKKIVHNQKSTARRKIKVFFLSFLFCAAICHLPPAVCFAEDDVAEYVKEAWASQSNPPKLYAICDECIAKFSTQADTQALNLKDFPPAEQEGAFTVMNKVAVCYFIKGEALHEGGSNDEAIKVLQNIVAKYPYAQEFDPSRGTYWKVAQIAKETIDKIGGIEELEKEWSKVEKEIKFELYDEGSDFPVDYAKYGEFTGVGTKNYKYIIKDPIGLTKAVGEGIYPNTTSLKFDPEFVKIKKQLAGVDHWKILNSRDLRTAFYKWNLATEPDGVKQFYIADILERNGLTKQAIKAYYAILVHFPNVYSWTYWHTPWYVAKASLYRIKYLLKENPQLGLKLEGASLEVINGYDNDVRNDAFVVNPGKLVKFSLIDKMSFTGNACRTKKRGLGKVVKQRGGERVKVVKYKDGDWQLLVEGKPFIVKGVTYGPTKVGESPDKGTQQNWSIQDVNGNGSIDAPWEAWIDKNLNNIQDSDEKPAGDFALMKDMGVNAIRLYHQPFKINKQLIRQMHQKYGIYIILGDFLGKYALGSKAEWNPGTIYKNPEHQRNMLESVKEMVLEFKDEPAVLFWILGNENVYGVACDADKDPESFFKFANEAALLIKSLDPQKRPVAIASGDILFLDVFARNAPDIDIFGANVYRGKYGFLDFWDEVKRVADRAAMITEYGAPSFAKGYTGEEAENFQAQYHRGCWLDIMCNSAGYAAGNAVGGFAFEWLDEWWKAYEPSRHDKRGLFTGPFLDGFMHEEWLGIVGQGDGKKSPFERQLKRAYFTYKELWNQN